MFFINDIIKSIMQINSSGNFGIRIVYLKRSDLLPDCVISNCLVLPSNRERLVFCLQLRDRAAD